MNGGLCVHKYFNFVEVSIVKTSMLPNNGTSVGQESKVETYRLVAAVICYVLHTYCQLSPGHVDYFLLTSKLKLKIGPYLNH